MELTDKHIWRKCQVTQQRKVKEGWNKMWCAGQTQWMRETTWEMVWWTVFLKAWGQRYGSGTGQPVPHIWYRCQGAHACAPPSPALPHCVIFATTHPSKMPKGSLRHWFLPECSFKTLTWRGLSFLCIRGEEMKLKSLHVWRRQELRLVLSWVTIPQLRKR